MSAFRFKSMFLSLKLFVYFMELKYWFTYLSNQIIFLFTWKLLLANYITLCFSSKEMLEQAEWEYKPKCSKSLYVYFTMTAKTQTVLGIATWTRAAALNLCLTQVWPVCGLLYRWHVKDIMRKKMKLKGKIYKHMFPALRLSVPEDFNLKWISLSQSPNCAHADAFCMGPVKLTL